MRRPVSNFQKNILPVIIAGIFTLLSCLLTYLLAKGDNKLSSREVTETKGSDGSVTKKQLEIYK